MVGRSKLDTNNKKFLPLYRSREFNWEERTLLKYVEPHTWFKDLKLGDKFKNDWKGRLTKGKRGGACYHEKGVVAVTKNKDQPGCGRLLKPGIIEGHMNVGKKKIVTTMFVPASRDSHLVRMIMQCEQEKNMHLTSGVKIMEQSGLPLALLFPAKFPIDLGCPKGLRCILCDNKGIKCAPSGVIYKAERKGSC